MSQQFFEILVSAFSSHARNRILKQESRSGCLGFDFAKQKAEISHVRNIINVHFSGFQGNELGENLNDVTCDSPNTISLFIDFARSPFRRKYPPRGPASFQVTVKDSALLWVLEVLKEPNRVKHLALP